MQQMNNLRAALPRRKSELKWLGGLENPNVAVMPREMRIPSTLSNTHGNTATACDMILYYNVIPSRRQTPASSSYLTYLPTPCIMRLSAHPLSSRVRL